MRIVSFFAGCGGLDLGFEQAGFNVVWANELEQYCRATYVQNHPNTEFVLGDIRKIDTDSIPDCDGFIGGPPCQSWSVGGKQKGLNDERGQLFLKYIELIKAKQPNFFVIENVKGMLDNKFKDVLEDFVARLDCAGYDVQWTLLDAVNFRIPQNRERVFFVGFKKELNVTFKFPNPTCSEPVALESAIGDITEEPNFYVGREKENIVKHKRPNHDVLISKFGSFYYRGNRRRGWQQPSFTINATADYTPLHPTSPKMMYFGHEDWRFQKNKMNKYRRLSVRECARIQTFPDDFVFEYDNVKDGYKMIGNAVPPRLGNEIAKTILTALNHLEATPSVQVQPAMTSKNVVLVGYYKNDWQKQLIIQNKLYYVRSDGRKGSMFKEDCTVVPQYLLVHHKSKADLYELVAEEPLLVEASFLNSLGFVTSGKTYLCFRIKSEKTLIDKELGCDSHNLILGQRTYFPYFTTIEKVIKEYEC
jgi:DNA (cytosine-5)-methyltransferase 1